MRLVIYGLLAATFTALVVVYALAREDARLTSCQHNLKQLTLAVLAYAYDSDDHLPLHPVQGDWMARRWTASPLEIGLRRGYHLGVAEPGPLWPYLKNCCLNRCPSDPDNWRDTYAAGAHPSYTWNEALSGRTVAQAKNQPLVWDNAPRHHRGRNVIYVPRPPTAPKIEWLPEAECGFVR